LRKEDYSNLQQIRSPKRDVEDLIKAVVKDFFDVYDRNKDLCEPVSC